MTAIIAPSRRSDLRGLPVGLALAVAWGFQALAQTPQENPRREPGPGSDGPPPFATGGPPGFRFGPPGMGQQKQVVAKHDKDGDGRLNAQERKTAREALAKEVAEGGGPRGPGGRRGGFGPPMGVSETPKPGSKLSPSEVRSFPNAPAYDPGSLRTFFIEFENADWEKELADFNNTDVEVPSTLTVDGKSYQDVGVHFRGMSSYMMIPEGGKRSLNLSLDFLHEKQDLNGYRTYNLLNSHEDPTFLRSILYLQIAREYLPAPKANFARVAINGESWGLYVSAQQFNKDFVKDWFGTSKGGRWKVPGSPGAKAGLEYLGDDVARYKPLYQIKSKDDPASWDALIRLCRVLNETPATELETALTKILDIEGAIRFLALENVFVNNDGYWVRASDYNLYLAADGRFHVLPHDSNETFSAGGGPPGFPGGPGGRGPGGPPSGGGQPGFTPPPDFNPGGPGGPPGPGPGAAPRDGGMMRRMMGGGIDLDPLIGLDDATKPLRSKLLAAPALRARYLGHVRQMAEKWLDWTTLGPVVATHRALIESEVRTDTRKLDSFDDFVRGVEGASGSPEAGGPRRRISLKEFAAQRRAFLLNHPEVKKGGA